MKKTKILASVSAIALLGAMSGALVGCGSDSNSSASSAASATNNNYDEIAAKVKAEESAHLDNAEKSNSAATETALPGEAILVESPYGQFNISIDEAYIAPGLKYADGDVACKLYYTVQNLTCADSEIDLRDIMLVETPDGTSVLAEPDARPSEDTGKTSAPLSIIDCPLGESIAFATHYGVPADTNAITVTIGGKSVEVLLHPFDE